MAIHPQVFVTPDRRWRIEANTAGTEFVLQAVGANRSLRPAGTARSVEALVDLLAEHDIDFADLIPG